MRWGRCSQKPRYLFAISSCHPIENIEGGIPGLYHLFIKLITGNSDSVELEGASQSSYQAGDYLSGDVIPLRRPPSLDLPCRRRV